MLRQNLFDIETYSPNIFPFPEKAEHSINSITIYDNFTDSYTSIIIDPSRAGQKTTYENWTIYFTKDERNLIILTVKLIKFFSPDVLAGWYSNDFDIPYLFNRCNNLEMKNVLNSISPLNYVNIKGQSISGMHLTDMIILDKKIKKRTSYTLANVAIEENLHVQKLENHENISEIYRTDKDRFVRYNKGDVEILTELEKKNRIIDFFENTRTFSGLNSIDEALMNSVIVDTVALRKAHREGIILPSKPTRDEAEESEDEERSGGFVKFPEPGIHRMVAVLDMAKFYPAILGLLNLSTETVVADNLTKDKINFSDGDYYVEYEQGKYVRINSKIKGFMPSLYEEFLTERLNIEAEMKKYEIGSDDYNFLMQKRQVVKDTSNSLPGVIGYGGFRLNNNIIANAITFTGQKMIHVARNKLAELKIKDIYGDTDSVHIEDSTLLPEEFVKKATELSEILSHGYVDVVKKEFNIDTVKSFEIDFESAFKTIIYIQKDDGTPAKKRYGARKFYEKGKYIDILYVRGFDMRRSDASNYCKNIQEQVLRLILWDKPREETIKYVQNMIANFKKSPLVDISTPKGINKPILEYGKINKNGKKGTIPAQITGAIYSNTYLGTNFTVGSKIKYFFVKRMPTGYQSTRILSFDDINKVPKNIEIDYDKMIDANIKKKIERILLAAGINWSDIEGQKSLFDF
jgi:DNA polymerase elongation subunit (family B)